MIFDFELGDEMVVDARDLNLNGDIACEISWRVRVVSISAKREVMNDVILSFSKLVTCAFDYNEIYRVLLQLAVRTRTTHPDGYISFAVIN